MPSIQSLKNSYPEFKDLTDEQLIDVSNKAGIDVWHEQEAVDTSTNNDGDIARGFKTSFAQVPQLGVGLLAAGAAAGESAFGEGGLWTGAKEGLVSKYSEMGNEISKTSKQSDDFDYSYNKAKEGDYSAAADMVQYGIGQALGQGIQMLAGSFVAGKIAQIGVKAFAKDFLDTLVTKEAEKLAGLEATSGIVGGIAQESIQRTAVKNVADRLADIGSKAYIASSAFGQEGGEIGGDLAQQSVNEGRSLTAGELARGVGYTFLAGVMEYTGDKIGLDAMMGKLGFGQASRAGRMLTGGLAAAPAESVTEYGQTITEEAGKGNDPLSEKTQSMARTGAFQGFVGGVVMGAGGGAFSSAPAPSPLTNPTPQDPPSPIGAEETQPPPIDTSILNVDAGNSLLNAAEATPTQEVRVDDILSAGSIADAISNVDKYLNPSSLVTKKGIGALSDFTNTANELANEKAQSIDDIIGNQAIRRESTLETLNNTLESNRAKLSQDKRLDILDSVLDNPAIADKQTGFAQELKQRGYNNLNPTEPEANRLTRHSDVSQALVDDSIFPSTPDEGNWQSVIKEKKANPFKSTLDNLKVILDEQPITTGTGNNNQSVGIQDKIIGAESTATGLPDQQPIASIKPDVANGGGISSDLEDLNNAIPKVSNVSNQTRLPETQSSIDSAGTQGVPILEQIQNNVAVQDGSGDVNEKIQAPVGNNTRPVRTNIGTGVKAGGIGGNADAVPSGTIQTASARPIEGVDSKLDSSVKGQSSTAPSGDDTIGGVSEQLASKTFPSKGAANLYIAKTSNGLSVKTHKIVAADGGLWKIEPNGQAKTLAPKNVVHKNDELLSAISKLGGLKASEAKAQGINPKSFNQRGHGILRVFNNGNNSKSYDEMAELLRGNGFDAKDVNNLVDKVSRATNQGEKIYTPEGYENVAKIKQEERVNDGIAKHAMKIENLYETAKQHDKDFGTKWYDEILKIDNLTNDDISVWEKDLNDDREFRYQKSNGDSEASPLSQYTESEIRQRETESKQREKDKRSEVIRKDEASGFDVFDEMMGNTPTSNDVFGETNPLKKVERAEKVKPIANEIRQGMVGDKLSSQEIVRTASGKKTTPFPKFDKINNQTPKKVNRWLLENAALEAESRGDSFNARSFRSDLERKIIPTASKNSAEEYLFGSQPEVIKSILKPLNNVTNENSKNKTVLPNERTDSAGNEKILGINEDDSRVSSDTEKTAIAAPKSLTLSKSKQPAALKETNDYESIFNTIAEGVEGLKAVKKLLANDKSKLDRVLMINSKATDFLINNISGDKSKENMLSIINNGQVAFDCGN